MNTNIMVKLASSLTMLVGEIRKGREGGVNRATVVLLIAGWLVMMVLPAGCDSGSSQPTQAPPAVTASSGEGQAPDGAKLLEMRCSVCHSADKPKQAKKTREEWEGTVARMIGKGAKLTETEKKAVVEYLSNR